MANYCNNYISISGDKESIDKIEEFFKSYSKFDNTTDWGDSVIKSDYTIDERIYNGFNKYGSRWFDFDLTRDSDEDLTINGDSAWSPMESLVGGLCYTFGVEGWIEYEEPGCDFGGRTSFNKDGEINEYEQMSYSEWMYKSQGNFWVSESLYDDLECNIDDYNTFEEFMSEYKFITSEDDREFLKESFNKFKNN
jgi:hypothetical protein